MLLNLEHTLARAKKALQRVRKSGGDHNIELALTELFTELVTRLAALNREIVEGGRAYSPFGETLV